MAPLSAMVTTVTKTDRLHTRSFSEREFDDDESEAVAVASRTGEWRDMVYVSVSMGKAMCQICRLLLTSMVTSAELWWEATTREGQVGAGLQTVLSMSI